MKRILALALALCMIFALAACGGGQKAAQSGPFKPTGLVTMIVAYKAGNGTDITARILARTPPAPIPPTPASRWTSTSSTTDHMSHNEKAAFGLLFLRL